MIYTCCINEKNVWVHIFAITYQMIMWTCQIPDPYADLSLIHIFLTQHQRKKDDIHIELLFWLKLGNKMIFRSSSPFFWSFLLMNSTPWLQLIIKVLHTDRRWREGTCLLICITFRPKNISIIIYQWPISHGRQYR